MDYIRPLGGYSSWRLASLNANSVDYEEGVHGLDQKLARKGDAVLASFLRHPWSHVTLSFGTREERHRKTDNKEIT